MTTQPPTTAGTFAPDWIALAEIVHESWHEALGNAQAVIAEYQRQAAAAGWVMVTCEDLEIAAEYLCFAASVWHGRGRPDVAKPITELRLRFEGMLAAARQEEQTDAKG